MLRPVRALINFPSVAHILQFQNVGAVLRWRKKLKIDLCTSLSIALRAKVTKFAHFESCERSLAP